MARSKANVAKLRGKNPASATPAKPSKAAKARTAKAKLAAKAAPAPFVFNHEVIVKALGTLATRGSNIMVTEARAQALAALQQFPDLDLTAEGNRLYTEFVASLRDTDGEVFAAAVTNGNMSSSSLRTAAYKAGKAVIHLVNTQIETGSMPSAKSVQGKLTRFSDSGLEVLGTCAGYEANTSVAKGKAAKGDNAESDGTGVTSEDGTVIDVSDLRSAVMAARKLLKAECIALLCRL